MLTSECNKAIEQISSACNNYYVLGILIPNFHSEAAGYLILLPNCKIKDQMLNEYIHYDMLMRTRQYVPNPCSWKEKTLHVVQETQKDHFDNKSLIMREKTVRSIKNREVINTHFTLTKASHQFKSI